MILEKATAKRVKEKRRERGVGGASVGKFKGGTLTLSQRDVARIQGNGRSRAR